MVVSIRKKRLVFLGETDLEDYLQIHLSQHLSLLGLNLLIIGRQLEMIAGRFIDLLAIDATGVIYIIELKLNQTTSSTTEQLLAYRRSVKGITRQQLIGAVARGRLQVDLLKAFQRCFGHPLPETVNASQVLVVIATSIHRRTAESLLELREMGASISAFRYVIQADALSLIPCDLDAPGEQPCAATKRRKRRVRSTFARPHRLPRYKVRIDLEWFWWTHAHRFVSPLVTFKSVYGLYEQWARTQPPAGLDLLSDGVFGRQLAALTAASGEWDRVFLPPGTSIEVDEPLTDPPSVRLRRDAGHWISAYQRTAVDKVPDTSGPRPGRIQAHQ
jgi:hypothetical protein